MRRLAVRLLLVDALALSCGDKADGGTSTGPATTSSDAVTSSSNPSTDPSTDPSTTASTADAPSTSSTTGGESTTSIDESTGAPDESLGCAFPEVHDSTDGNSDPVMETWGAACTSDAECVALVGEGGVCFTEAIVYELPNGYCTKLCELPDGVTRVVMNDPSCAPDGGVACVGQQNVLSMCAILCTDDAQCNRDGYVCRQLPLIATAEDPSLCLMPDCCQGSCAEG